MNFIIKTKQDMEDAINQYGILPLFKNSIPGFSIEEHASPDIWFTDKDGPWEWKGPVIRELNCAYGKFFEGKAAFIRQDLFADFANYRRDGYDFDARFDDELASYTDKQLFDLTDQNAPILSKELKKLGNYKKDGNKGFDTIMNRLQYQCYIIVNDFVYSRNKKGELYGWGVAQYTTPEKMLGESFTSEVYRKKPEDSLRKIIDHLKTILPDTDEPVIRHFIEKSGTVSKIAANKIWLVPSNPKFFDVVSAFEQQDEIHWKQGNRNMKKGDLVYLYVGAPYSAILYECEITQSGIPFTGYDEHVNIKELMMIRRLRIFPPDYLNLPELKKYDVVSIRCARSMPADLARDIKLGHLKN